MSVHTLCLKYVKPKGGWQPPLEEIRGELEGCESHLAPDSYQVVISKANIPDEEVKSRSE